MSVVRTLDKLELFGADLSTPSRRYRLSVAYVSLTVEQNETMSEADKRPPPIDRSAASDVDLDDDIGKLTVSIEDILAKSRCILIRGQAGSGKTTLLQWAAVKSASRSFNECLA